MEISPGSGEHVLVQASLRAELRVELRENAVLQSDKERLLSRSRRDARRLEDAVKRAEVKEEEPTEERVKEEAPDGIDGSICTL